MSRGHFGLKPAWIPGLPGDKSRESWQGGRGGEEFGRNVPRRLSLHSVSPAPHRAQAWPPLFLPPKQQPTNTFFPSPPSLWATEVSYRMSPQAVIPDTPSPPAWWPLPGPHGGCRESMCVFFWKKKIGERMCCFPYPPCGSQPLTFRKFSLLSDLSLSYCGPFPVLPMEV